MPTLHGPVSRNRPSGILLHCSAICVVALIVTAPALVFGMGQTDSSRYSYVWAAQFDQLMLSGNAYPRWLPLSFAGFGSPTFFFYPPLAFFVVSTVNWLYNGCCSVQPGGRHGL